MTFFEKEKMPLRKNKKNLRCQEYYTFADRDMIQKQKGKIHQLFNGDRPSICII